jgi:hypothetical protein
MANNGVDDFKSKLVGGGARPNLFRVICPFPAGTGGSIVNAEFLIKAAALPSSTQGTIEVPYRGRKLKIPGDRTFEQWTIKVINDTSFNLRNAFENWIDLVNPPTSNSGVTDIAQYAQQVTVYQLDKASNDIKSYGFHDCYPVTVGAIELSYESNDAIEEFDVTFNYQYFLTSSTTYPGTSAGGIGSILAGLKSGIKSAATGAISRATGGIVNVGG